MKYERRRTVYLDDHGQAVPRDRAMWRETTYFDGRGKLVRREMEAMRPGGSGRGGPAAASDPGGKLPGVRGPGEGEAEGPPAPGRSKESAS